MEESINPTINIGPVTFDLTLTALTLLSVFLIFAFIYWASRNMTLKPKGKQNVLEYLYDFVNPTTKSNKYSNTFCFPVGLNVIFRVAQ